MSNRWNKLWFLLLLVPVLLGLWIMRERNRSSKHYCIVNIRQIEGAKDQWALAEKKRLNDAPSWEELIRGKYLYGKPVCPKGGTYTIGQVGEASSCSIKESH